MQKNKGALGDKASNNIVFDGALSSAVAAPIEEKEKPRKKISIVKLKLKRYKDLLKDYSRLKSLRINIEKMRIICGLVTRREKMKNQLELLNQNFFEAKVNALLMNKNIEERESSCF